MLLLYPTTRGRWKTVILKNSNQRINLRALRRWKPGLSDVFKVLQNWCELNPNSTFIMFHIPYYCEYCHCCVVVRAEGPAGSSIVAWRQKGQEMRLFRRPLSAGGKAMRCVRHSRQVCVQSSTLGVLKTVMGSEADGNTPASSVQSAHHEWPPGLQRIKCFLPNISVLFSILFYSCCVVKVKS